MDKPTAEHAFEMEPHENILIDKASNDSLSGFDADIATDSEKFVSNKIDTDSNNNDSVDALFNEEPETADDKDHELENVADVIPEATGLAGEIEKDVTHSEAQQGKEEVSDKKQDGQSEGIEDEELKVNGEGKVKENGEKEEVQENDEAEVKDVGETKLHDQKNADLAATNDSSNTNVNQKEVIDSKIENDEQKELNSIKEAPQLLPQLHTVLIPAFSHWFDLKNINERETEELPEFFIKDSKDRSKTPLYYKTVRNFIVNTYRINPNEKLTFLSIRRNLTGDVGSLLRIFKFLVKWGLINYQVTPDQDIRTLQELEDASNIETPNVSNAAKHILGKNLLPADTSHFKVSSDAPKGLYPFKSYKPSINVQDLDYLKNIIKNKNNGNSSDISETVKNLLKRKLDDTEEDRSNKKQKKKDIWRKEEYSKLIELFYFFSKGGTCQIAQPQWLKIAQEINNLPGTETQKTTTDCILKFLQVPLDDDFLLDNEKTGILKYAPYLNGLGVEGAMGNANNVANPLIETLTTLIGYADIKKLQETLNFLKEKKQSENSKVDTDPNSNAVENSNFNELVNLGFTSLAIRADKMAVNEYTSFILEMATLIENNIEKINLKIKKNDVLEKLKFKEIEKLQKERLDFKLEKMRIKQGIEGLKNKYNSDQQHDELFQELADLVNKDCNFEKREVPLADQATEKLRSEGLADDDDELPLSVKSPAKYRYWVG